MKTCAELEEDVTREVGGRVGGWVGALSVESEI